jgi:hypothetical protein
VLRRSDLVGVDPIHRLPTSEFGEVEIVDMTLLKIVRDEELVAKLGVLDLYYPSEATRRLSRGQRQSPDRTVNEWSAEDKDLYYRAAAIVIATIKERNPDLSFQWLLTPGRRIVLPDPSLF